ncbi:hypothetical protein [Aureimonas sp. ME7]|uniref:hypothetical protein n=1 Tax=Aureimonas sp. ME7 TaxID=2744252 RepID=UPI0015F50D1E|nr:hypothetical protein [Aureimonas sp. ME7]
MFVVRLDQDGIRRFQAFRHLADAKAHARRQDGEDLEPGAVALYDVPDTNDAEIAVIAVRDGLAVPVLDAEPDPAVLLASMGLGTGLRI